MALGVKFDLLGPYTMVKGLPWSLHLTRKAGAAQAPVDLSGCSARLVIHDLLAVLAVPPADPLTFDTVSGNIVLGGVAGTIEIDLDETETLLTAERAGYRLYLTDALGKETLLMRGRLGLVEENE